MLRIKTSKTKLYKLVREYEPLPPMKRTTFAKTDRRASYRLKWPGRGRCWRCEAYISVVVGYPKLTITKKDIDGMEISRLVYTLDINELIDRGMVEEFHPAAERRRMEGNAT